MTTISTVVLDAGIPALLERAAFALASAKTSGEVLEARDIARTAYDAAKSAARMARAKQAHDDVMVAVHHAQADAALIEARASMRLADEYDRAQERGEVRRNGQAAISDKNSSIPTVADIGLSSVEIHDARTLRDAEIAEPGIVERTINNRLDAGLEPTKTAIKSAAEDIVRPHVSNNSGNNEWYTPREYIEAARVAMGSIDVDPASSSLANQTVRAGVFFTALDDGLTKKWGGNVWLNPPYAQPLISDFADTISSKFEAKEIDQACILVNNATETAWFQRMLENASAVCFPRSRIKFIDMDGKPSGAPLQGQAVIYMGNRTESFRQAFADKGRILFCV